MRICEVPGCDRDHSAKGCCRMHYNRLQEGRRLDAPIQDRSPIPKCRQKGCDRISRAKGYCDFHYHRVRLGRRLDAPIQKRRPIPSVTDKIKWAKELLAEYGISVVIPQDVQERFGL